MDRPWTRSIRRRPARTCRRSAGRTCRRSSTTPSRRYRDQPAFTLFLPNGTQGTITYGEVDRASDAFAVYLREVAGFAAGDRIALQMPNCLAYPIAVFGCLKAGLVMVNTNPLYTAPEMVAPVQRQRRGRARRDRRVRDQGRRGAAEDGDPTVVLVSVADLLPPLKRFVVRTVQKYVKKMMPPAPFAHVTFPTALAQGARALAGGRRSARVSGRR